MSFSALAERLGWTVVHSLWQGIVIAGALAIALRLLRGASAAARHCACIAAFIAMLGAMVVTAWQTQPATLAMPAQPVARLQSAKSEIKGSGLPPSPEIRAESPPAPEQTLTAAAPASRFLGEQPPTGTGPARTSTRVSWQERLVPFLPWISGGWIVGVLLLSLRHLGGWWRVRTLRRRAVVPPPAFVQQTAALLARRLGLRRPARVLMSARAVTPLLAGVLKPVVLLPGSLVTGFQPRELEAILAHELAHLARGDTWANAFQLFAETILFYHPAAWWIGRCARIERENAADDLAVRIVQEDRLTYAGALARLAEIESANIERPLAVARFEAKRGRYLMY